MGLLQLLEETHKRIAEKIAQELGIGERHKQLLVKGCLAPDLIGDFPHHKGKEFKIFRDIVNAIFAYRKNDDECYYELGKALHYIQDRWTARPRTPQGHTKWEQQISDCKILDNLALEGHIEKAIFPSKVIKAYLSLLNKVVEGIEAIPCSLLENMAHDKNMTHDQKGLSDFLWKEWRSGKTSLTILLRIMANEKEEFSDLPWYLWRGGRIRFAMLMYYALRTHPVLDSDGRPYSTPLIDLNFTYRICLEVARCALSPDADWGKAITEEKEAHHGRLRIIPVVVGFAWLFLGLGVFAMNMGKYLQWSYIAAWMVMFGIPCIILFKLSFHRIETVEKTSEEETPRPTTITKEDTEDEATSIYREAFPELNDVEADLQETQEVDMDFEEEDDY